MKKLGLLVAIFIGCLQTASAAPPDVLTSLRAVHSLSNAQAASHAPVAIEATVLYYRGYERTLFIEDEGFSIYAEAPPDAKLLPGDRILVRGISQPSFRPFIAAQSVTLLRHGAVPPAVPATFDQLIGAERDCMLVKARGVVRAADVVLSSMIHSSKLQMQMEGGSIEAVVDNDDAGALRSLLDAEVEVTAVASGRFDGKMQQTGVVLHVSSMADILVLHQAATSPWALPVLPMDEVLTAYHSMDFSKRVHVRGTITYYQPGSAVVLQDGHKSLWINTRTIAPLVVGDEADATGFPSAQDGFLTVTAGEIADTHRSAPVMAEPLQWQQLATSKHIFDLVSTEGTVVTAVRGSSQDEYALDAGGYAFSAIYRHPEVAGVVPLSPMKQIAVGSRVRVTGICVLDSANPFDRNVPFNLLLRSSDDLAVLARPSWFNIPNLTRIVGALLLGIVAVAAGGWTLRRRVRLQTALLAAGMGAEAALERRLSQIEQRRSRILEDINGTAQLPDILEQIAGLCSFRLGGAACWCELADGTRLGASSPEQGRFHVLQEEIPGRSGGPLGRLFAAFGEGILPTASDSEALFLGARLASVAIETRRLYSDLLHRSQFDLLTDIHNRFSLEQHLQALVAEARGKGLIFGLIYVDLDGFKQVNDLYGHRIGDLYLQEVASRMKRQLRTGDLLARLGGDEFAALVPVVRSRAGVEEIALRMERCFNEPLLLEGYTLQGAASFGIALYPDDGSTGESLLHAADSAMYMAKYTKAHGGMTGLHSEAQKASDPV